MFEARESWRGPSSISIGVVPQSKFLDSFSVATSGRKGFPGFIESKVEC